MPDTADELDPLKAVTHAVTRWSSAYLMLRQLRCLRVPLIDMLKRDLVDIEIDWKSVDGLCRLLGPFHVATQDLQGGTRPTMSRLWEHLTILRWTCEDLEGLFAQFPAEVQHTRERLLHEMNQDSAFLNVDDFVRICTVVDPTRKVRMRCSTEAGSVALAISRSIGRGSHSYVYVRARACSI